MATREERLTAALELLPQDGSPVEYSGYVASLQSQGFADVVPLLYTAKKSGTVRRWLERTPDGMKHFIALPQ